LPEGLDAIVVRCLQKDPEWRFQSAQELADALAPYADHVQSERTQSATALGVSAAPGQFSDMPTLTQATWGGGPSHVKRSPQRRLIMALIGASITVAAGALWLATRASSQQAPTPVAHEPEPRSAATTSPVTSDHPAAASMIEAAPVTPESSSTPVASAPRSTLGPRPQTKAKTRTKPPLSDDPFADPR
jgi:serine/threonine-protein kinase